MSRRTQDMDDKVEELQAEIKRLREENVHAKDFLKQANEVNEASQWDVKVGLDRIAKLEEQGGLLVEALDDKDAEVKRLREENDTLRTPVKDENLQRRLVGLTKAVGDMEPGAREFCLAAISEWLDFMNGQQAEVERLRADLKKERAAREEFYAEVERLRRIEEAAREHASECDMPYVGGLRAALEEKP